MSYQKFNISQFLEKHLAWMTLGSLFPTVYTHFIDGVAFVILTLLVVIIYGVILFLILNNSSKVISVNSVKDLKDNLTRKVFSLLISSFFFAFMLALYIFCGPILSFVSLLLQALVVYVSLSSYFIVLDVGINKAFEVNQAHVKV